jgi:hypothetical protein
MVVDSEECGLAEGMGLQSERVVRMSETPSLFFFSVRSVIIDSRLR